MIRLPYKLILLANSLANEASQNAHVRSVHCAFPLHLLRILLSKMSLYGSLLKPIGLKKLCPK